MRFSWDVLWPIVGAGLIALAVDRLSAGGTQIGAAALVLGIVAFGWGLWRLKVERDRARHRGRT